MNEVHVAAAVIVNSEGEFLIALRPKEKHQGGLWEFPGGKVEPGETVLAALNRELHEELGINVKRARPFIRVAHQYSDKAVLLDVWYVDQYEGVPCGREGQQTKWVAAGQLNDHQFPAANHPIVTACRLPSYYLVTPEPQGQSDFLAQLESSLKKGIKLVQLRAKRLSEDEYKALALNVLRRCRAYDAKLMLNAPPEWLANIPADGIHLTGRRLMALKQRPLGGECWLAASCHNEAELHHAVKVGVDFVVLAPINKTATHPEATPLGWTAARALTDQVAIPVYFLGGLTRDELPKVFHFGGQGIAAIRGLWAN